MNSADRQLSMSAAARLLKVSPSTMQRMCNRGLLRCEQTQGGHRRVWLSDLSKLSEQLRGEPLQVASNSPITSLDVPAIADLLLKGAEVELLDWLLSNQQPTKAVLVKLENQLHPAIMELDKRFVEQRISSFAIWLAINTARSVLEKLITQLAMVKSRASRAVGGAIAGPHDRLAVCYVEAALRLCGIDALGLTVQLTPALLADVAHRVQANMVWVNHTHVTDASRVIQWHRELASRLRPGIRVLIGGGSLSPALLRQLPPHTHYPSLMSLLEGESQAARHVPMAGPHFSLPPTSAVMV